MATPTALFIIDIQHDLAIDPATRIPAADRVNNAATSILAAARSILATTKSTAAPPPALLVFVQHEEEPERGPLQRGTEAWKLAFEPRGDADEELLVHKTTGDTFESNPDLALMLKASGVTDVVAFGIQSECCVESTCSGALDAGFRVTLLSGAHSTYDVEGKTAGEIEREVEGRLKAKGARVVGWEEVVKGWVERGSFEL